QEAVRLNPDHTGARQGLARTLLQAGRRDEAGDVFEEWLRKEPGNPVILYLQAACLGKGVPDRAPDPTCSTFSMIWPKVLTPIW
ncbi:MAG: tetratricopeptide repeat protein, partial [Deltaproteobacteria bacterium]|nr:tetratricopeptide repeat protein [Deltaproteobacteria bacterium]